MAEDLLPLVGVNIDGHDESSDSDSENDMGEIELQILEDEADEEADEDEDVESDDDSNNTGDRETAPNVTYDKSLPGTHSYLGEDMEEVRGRTVHEDDSYLNLPLFSLPGVVLVPGQTLPLHLFQPAIVSMMRNIVQRDNKTFGFVTSRYQGGNFNATHAPIGTTAEILAIKEEDEGIGLSTVRVKAIGRQRFELLETRRQADGILIAKVRIMPERILPNPLEGVVPASYQRLCRPNPGAISSSIDSSGGGDVRAMLSQWIKNNKSKKSRFDRFSSAYFTHWPPWVYKQYDAYLVMDRVKRELQSWNETLKEENMPLDVTEFSFWVAGNLPLDDRMKIHLLGIDCAVQRLRCELSIMQRCTVLCCKECESLIANKKDVFSMAVEGPMAAYVNPGGYVHETLTVYKVKGLNLVGGMSTENSWFPGYAWTILQCRQCHAHMGWKFTAAKKKLKPEKFWGLCRSSIQPSLQKQDEEEEDTWMPTL